MSLKHGLLGLLNYGPMTGYELDKAFSASLSFFWQAKTSQIYRELDAMERGGWLRSEKIIQEEKPNKRLYHLTDSGREELTAWLNSDAGKDIAEAMTLKSAWFMRIFFAGETDEAKALGMLRAYRESCLAQKLELKKAEKSAENYRELVKDENKTRYWELISLFGELYYRAGLSWAEQAIKILETEQA